MYLNSLVYLSSRMGVCKNLQAKIRLMSFTKRCFNQKIKNLKNIKINNPQIITNIDPKKENSNVEISQSEQARLTRENNLAEEIVIHQGEIKDSLQIFEMAWNNIYSERGDENMNFPKEILFLSGAPGAGKGEMGDFIKKVRGITTPTIETSQILQSKEANSIKEKGGLVASRHVVQLVLKKLLEPQFANGVVVDGFPRTKVQGECIKHLYDKMDYYKKKYSNTIHREKFNRPLFTIMVLFVEESVSVQRQLLRGSKIDKHNRRVKETGFGSIIPLRNTDIERELARQRYLQFKNHIFESLQTVKKHFNFHFILADAVPEVVKSRILKELKYQSSNELTETTFEMIRRLPLAAELGKSARVNLIKRLEEYARNHSVLFENMIKLLERDFFHIIKYNAISGSVIIRSENEIFKEKYASRMAVDLLTERGYNVVLDVQKQATPVRVEKGGIIMKEFCVYHFKIDFPKPTIRHYQKLMI